MLCPWCMHYGAEDEEYLFDEDLFCGICAQQMPSDEAGWIEAFRAFNAEMISYIEQELNKIAVSKSGLRPETLAAMGEAIEALAALREAAEAPLLLLPETELARWAEFACTYYAPQLR
jgi:hypothetical protein